jgi:Kef-type K+ transport system membrane component KefB
MENGMESFRLLAHPWWVNLLLLVPLVAYFLFSRKRPQLTSRELLTAAVFALSFGFVEGAVAIDLGAAIGLLPGYARTLSDLARLSADLDRQAQPLSNLPPALMTVEVFREAATMLMLLSAAILAKQKRGERFAIFLWIFALWDIGYYLALWATVRWPYSPTSPDVLFLFPVPWTSQVWFPILISILTVAVVLWTRRRGRTT